MAYVIESGNFPADPFGRYAYGNWFTSAIKSVGRAIDVTSSKSLVRKAGRAVDITSSKSLTGRIPIVGSAITSVARMGVATAKVMTGFTAIEAAVGYGAKAITGKSNIATKDVQRTLPEAAKGFAVGAAVGGAILAGGSVASAIAGAGKGVVSSATPAQPTTEIPASTEPTVQTQGGGGSILPLILGGAGGFLVAGPVGAVVGAGAATVLTRKAA